MFPWRNPATAALRLARTQAMTAVCSVAAAAFISPSREGPGGAGLFGRRSLGRKVNAAVGDVRAAGGVDVEAGVLHVGGLGLDHIY